MKYCKNCKALNLNEQIFCRKCNHQFEDFDWDAVEHENIYSDSLNDQFRQTDRDIYNKYFDISIIKDGIKFIIWTIICVYGMHYGLNNSLWYYYIFEVIYFMIITIKYYKLFFKIFNVSVEEKIGDKIFYNYKIESSKLILAGLLIITSLFPFYMIDSYRYSALFAIGFPISIVGILLGLDFFIRSKVFNTYNDYYYVITFYLMFLMPSSALMGLLNLPMYYSLHNITLNIIWITLYLIIFFSILFLDKINKYTKYDVRVSLWFLFYAIGAPFIPAVSCFIFLMLIGVIHY